MTKHQEFELMSAIIDRAERLGIARNRTTHFIDLDKAHKAFSLKLDAFLHANVEDFAHDFIGIWSNIDRNTGEFTNFFLPRFAEN